MTLDPIQKDKIVDEIREFFGADTKENLIRLKYERVKQIIFIIIGLLLLIASNFLNTIHIGLAGQVLSIFGWLLFGNLYIALYFLISQQDLKTKEI